MLLSRRALTGRLDLRSEPLAAIYVRGFIHQMSPAAFMRIPAALSDRVGAWPTARSPASAPPS